MACYSAAGATFGTVTAGLGVAPAIIACNTSLGYCMMCCNAALFTPTLWLNNKLINIILYVYILCKYSFNQFCNLFLFYKNN